MRIPAGIFALLLALPCTAQQSSQSQNQDQNQSSSQSQNQNQNQSSNQSADKSQSNQSQSDKSQSDKSEPAKHHSTAEDNPFPEDISKKAAAAADSSTPDAPGTKPANSPDKPPTSSNGSKPPAPDYSSSRTGLQSLDSNDPESRISDGAGGYILNPKLAAQDLKVGSFYFTNGDYKGAYSRFKEATLVDPGNADAVFSLAEAAKALKLNGEAAENYRIYLDALPDGPKAKAARKALAELGEAKK
jgi:tetratricopeptide (TPR) repeat protein